MRISRYQTEYPTSATKLLGTNEFGRTRNFTLNDIRSFLSISATQINTSVDWSMITNAPAFTSSVDWSMITNAPAFTSSVDWSSLTNVPYSTSSSDGILSSTIFNEFSSAKPSQNSIVLLSATQNTIISYDNIKEFDIEPNYVNILCQSPTTGTYSVKINIYSYQNSSYDLIAVSELTNVDNNDFSTVFVNYKTWVASIELLSGDYPQEPIIVKVVKC